MKEKFTFQVEAPLSGREKIILVKGDSETRGHIILKLLAYLIFYDKRLKVEAEAGMHFKPDLMIADDRGRPEVWIDCGVVAPRKSLKLVQQLKSTRIIIVKKTRREIDQYARLLTGKKDETCSRIEYRGFERGFVDALANALEKNNEWTMYYINESTLGIVLNECLFESEIYSISPERPGGQNHAY